MGDRSKIEWCDATCRPCGARLTPENRVEPGRRICRTCRNAWVRSRYVRRGPPPRRGWQVPARDGDKKQARRRVNYLVEQGLIPKPADLPCMDCADSVFSHDYRHEYDHYAGYDGPNQLLVEVVCSKCHRNREAARRG